MAKPHTKNDSLLVRLKERFEKNAKRHPGVKWDAVAKKLDPSKFAVVTEMENTGGEPDVVELNGVLVFADCSPESPERRSCCYDGEALRSRKENKPKTSALEFAKKIGVELLDEVQYAALQKVGPFDEKTSSWVLTPNEVRKLGGALYSDYRYGRVFVGHNGAESYYAARGFRGFVKL